MTVPAVRHLLPRLVSAPSVPPAWGRPDDPKKKVLENRAAPLDQERASMRMAVEKRPEQRAEMAAAADPERALLLSAAAGDAASARRLFREHVTRVHRTVSRILGPHDGDVDDVVQQVFVAALDGAANFDGRSRVSTWLVGIATRRALDAARDRHRRDRWSHLKEWVGLGQPRARPDVVREARQAAEWALGHLTPDQRAAFVLFEVEGHTLAEISAMTGVGISTIHARAVAARKRLDALLPELAETGGRDGANAAGWDVDEGSER